MAVFENCSVLLELKYFPFKEKKRLKSAVTENGGNISFVVNKQCSLIVTDSVSNLSSNRLRSIQKYQTPVVGVEYVYSCLDRGVLLPVDEYKLDASSASTYSPSLPLSSLRPPVSKVPTSKVFAEPSKGPAEPVASASPTPRAEKKSGSVLGKFRIYTETDSDLPTYPDNFQVAKYSIFEKINSSTWCVLELQSVRGEEGWQYRVVRYWKDDTDAKKAAVRDMLVFLSTSEEALEVFKALRKTLQDTGLQLRSSIPPQARDLGSAPLQQLLLEEQLNTGSLSQEVGVFVELLWTEALGCLGNILSVSVDKLSLNDVSRVEGLLLQAQRKLREADHTETMSLLIEVYALLPLRKSDFPPSAQLISQKLDLCQLIRDVLTVSEMTLRSPKPSCVGKYRALRCSIEAVHTSSAEFQAVAALLQDSKVQIQQVLRVCRGVELQTFKSQLGNIKPLLHSSSPGNFVGVLSRGLLLPRVGVEHHGIKRTDVGNLGSGIYFSDAIGTSLKYSKPSETDGSRLLLVCDVALGRCKDVHERHLTLTEAPEGHHSVHGVRHTSDTRSEFEDDEYVVYSPDQVKLKYVVQFSLEGDQLKEFSPAIDTSAEPCLPSSDQEVRLEDDGVESIKNPLEDVTAGLLDSSGQQLPLQAVHVKCKLMDLLSQVVIFQKYTNLSSVPIEAKYVFPLDDSAAVCGFEAFINGKHVVGQVKEKEKARREYKQAIEKGHGAYLMDQDAPDVFTISVGNLPPGATVLIKVTFVSELMVRDGSILFSLPGSVAPWQESAALNQTTQVTVEKVCVTDEAASGREFTLDMSVEMPHEITSLKCITHKVKIKRTDCKAVLSVLPGEAMSPEGFQLSVTLSEVHLPRMWVEKHPDKDSQACMLVFYPDFDVNSGSASDEVVLLLDTSESMKGETLRTAQRLALQVLKTLDRNLRLNVILFGTDHTDAFLTARPLVEARQAAGSFIKGVSPVGGSTELWRPLRALSLLPPSRGVRNLLLLSDGHIQNAELTLRLLRDNAQHSRLFTCGLSPTANRHMLRALAQAGGGAYEFFDTKTKHNWAEKVACQLRRMASPGCSSVSVKWQQFNPVAPPPVQAPKQLHALFNDCHTLVFGFVPHCTQATLLGNLSGQELKTMVSTTELQKTRGTFLHKLTARALIRDYEDGSLHADEAEHEGKKAELKHFIIELSKEFSILSQFTSFVAIEERDSEQTEEGFTDIPKLIAEEDVDFLPYISWISPQDSEVDEEPKYLSDTECSSVMDDEGGVSEEEEEDISVEEQRGLLEHDSSSGLCALRFSDSMMQTMMKRPGRRETRMRGWSHKENEAQSYHLFGMSAQTSLPPPPPPTISSLTPPQLLASGPPPPPLLICPASLSFYGSPPPPPPPPPPPLLSPLPVGGSPPIVYQLAKAHRSLGDLKFQSIEAMPVSLNELSLPENMLHRGKMALTVKMSSEGVKTRYGHESSPKAGLSLTEEACSAPEPTASTSKRRFTVESVRGFSGSGVIEGFPGTVEHPSASPVFATQTKLRKRFGYPKRLNQFAADRGEPQAVSGDSGPCSPGSHRSVQFRALSAKRKTHPHPPVQRPFERKSENSEALKLRWTKIFQMQRSEGYWEFTTALGEFINVDVDVFANVFLKDKGIRSLGVKAHADILRLLATLLVLQLMRVEKLEEGKQLRTLFCLLDDSTPSRSERWQAVKRAVDWVCWADRQYPCVYSRLEFGWSWESSTRQLLGFEVLPPFSPLSGLNLQRTAIPLLVR